MSQALVGFGGVSGFLYLGLEMRLRRVGRMVPRGAERAYMIFVGLLMTTVAADGVIRLLV